MSVIIFGQNIKLEEKIELPKIEQKILNKEIFVGDIIDYQIELTTENNELVYLNPPNLSPFEIIKISEDKKEDVKTKKTNHKFNLQLSIYKTGEFTIPSFELTYLKNNEQFKLDVLTQKVNILSVISQNEEVKDVKNLKNNISVKEKTYIVIWIGIAILFILITILVVYVVRYKLKAKKSEKIIIKKSANEIAYEKLSKLLAKKYIENNEIKKYYFEISEILREYLGNRFNFESIELTTYELKNKLLNIMEIDRNYLPLITNFLEDTDLVKFSKFFPDKDEIERITKGCFSIIEKSTVETPKIEESVQGN